ncbi:MAG: hypothetical protein DHS20C01_13310 [marine bacterium B5-7]|nr:MAG: hypothetical protein DHS20C01_13310 [marine bacterium B5-7]
MNPLRLACFISEHGFGHATRTSAILTALQARIGSLEVDIFSAAPRKLFNLPGADLRFHSERVDVGLVQRNAFEFDLDATVHALDSLLPFDDARVEQLANLVAARRCHGVICDIAPIGLAVARRVGIPGILVENFTWDWIYRNLAEPCLEVYAEILEAWFETASLRIQAEPVCAPHPTALTTLPISRMPKFSSAETRRLLAFDEQTRVVLLSLGGTAHDFSFIDRVQRQIYPVHLLLAGETSSESCRVARIPAEFDHPSLMASFDAVIGKAGYSTVAEAYACGVPFGCFSRPGFPESAVITNFVRQHLPNVVLDGSTFASGDWAGRIDHLLSLQRHSPQPINGANQAARLIVDRLLPVVMQAHEC